MTALNKTSGLWSARLSRAVRQLEAGGGSDVQGYGPDCCWVICNICCWVRC